MEYPPHELYEYLSKTATILSGEDGKGILSVDESLTAFNVMFKAIFVENNEEMRRQYRQILFSAPGLASYISGVLLSEEAIQQRTNQGTPFPEFLKHRGIFPGISIDQGLKAILTTEGEWVTQGLDGLAEKCSEFKKSGCVFTNWRTVFKVNRANPTPLAIQKNVLIMARYATISQAKKLVPLVETELVTDGSSHPLERTQKVLEKILAALFKALHDYKVILEGMILRVSMVQPGNDSKAYYSSGEVANATLSALQRTVPPAVAGIMFLSSEQLIDQAIVTLDSINCIKGRKPWPLTFGYSRPFQAGVLITWLGRDDWVPRSQDILVKIAQANSAATRGTYVSDIIQQKIEAGQFTSFRSVATYGSVLQ